VTFSAGTGQQPRDAAPASWLAVRPGLSPHGLRHGHQTWLDDLGVQEVLKSERMGHEIPGMAGVYGHGGGLDIPGPGRAPDQQAVAFAAELIDRSGTAPVIEAALARRTGRRRPLPVRAVLTALVCLALDDRPLFLTEVTRLLFCQLPPACRRMPGVPGAATTPRAFQAAYRRVRYCFHAIVSVADPSALPENRRLTEDELRARTKPITPGLDATCCPALKMPT